MVQPASKRLVTEATMSAGVAASAQSFRGLKAALAQGTTSTGLGVLSDSTGVNTTRWPHRLWQALAAQYPAYTFHARHWNDANQDYDAPIVIQTGTGNGGGLRGMNIINGNLPRRLPNNPTTQPHITGTIDVRVNVFAADWTPADPFGATILVGESGGTGLWSWSFSIQSAGYLRMWYSADGTGPNAMTSSVVASIPDGSTRWVRCVFTPNDGAGNRVAKFYTSTDGVTWTQLGATVTTAGAVTLNDTITAGPSSNGYLLGPPTSASNPTAFTIYEVDIRNGENGPPIAPRLPEQWGYYGSGTSHPIVGAPIATLVNGAKTGAGIPYLDDANRKKLLTPSYGQQVTVLSTSHNETASQGRNWANAYAAWVASVRAIVGPALIAITQNPERPGVTGLYQTEHAQRRLDLLGFARSLGLDVIDTYKAFLDYGPSWTTDLMGDDVHPNPAGSDLQRDVIKAAFDRA